MKRSSLRWMIALMVGLAALRGRDWWNASHEESAAAPEVSAAVDRGGRASPPTVAAAAPAPAVVAFSDAATAAVPTHNVFAARLAPAPPPPVPVQVAPPPPKPFVGPPLPPPPPPPPPPPALEVIGTWEDAQGLSVFVSNGRETSQARQGDLLFSQYRVTQMSADRIVIHDPSRKSDFTYPVPRVDARMNPPPHP